MRYLLIPLLILPLAACPGGIQPLDGKKFLASLEGPKVPSVDETLMENARNAEKQGNFAQAAQFYQQILEKDGTHKDAQLGMAEAYRRTGEFDRAIVVYDALLAQDPASVGAKEGKGLALMAKGDLDSPVALFEDVMKADPMRWKTLNGLGILFSTRNLQTESQQYFQEALKYSPSNSSVLNNLALSQALDHNYTAATSNLMLASSLANPGSNERKRIDLNLALVYAASGRLSDARNIAANYYSGAALNNNLGLYAHLAKDDQLAKSYLNMALTENKTFYEKAWENLQTLGTAGNDQGMGSSVPTATVAAPAPKAEEKSAAAPKPKAKAKAKAKLASKPKAAPKPAPAPAPVVEKKEEPAAAVAPEPAAAAAPAAKANKSTEDEDLSKILNATE